MKYVKWPDIVNKYCQKVTINYYQKNENTIQK